MGITKIINRCLLLISILCLSFTLGAAQDSSHQISEGNQYIQGQLSLMQDNIRETNLLNVVSYNIDYSNGDTYEITFVLHGDIFSLSFDKQSKATTISGVSATGEDIVIDKKYKKIFADLNHALQLEANEFKKIQTNDNTDAIKYLFKFADFLNSYPIDMPVNLIIKSEVRAI
ncbi:hypothetical protein HQQ94_00965 [Shewanella sp. VB17]|uniref:hypothetical protein n=1 Tax=Shewanella sp. VB17 TaxID=2739432 RepID=UPI001566EEE9|nr:hypothetical protein [Shewanella sp. VB17]NRD71842.1 hypothetical protein [Shewanella sp. VB17]